MPTRRLRFGPGLLRGPGLTSGDALVLLLLVALLYAGVRLAFGAPRIIAGPSISTSPSALPWYAILSTARMTAAYVLSLAFSLAYGYAAARNRSARRILLPFLDVLQSVPILSFLPVVVLSLNAILPQAIASELAAILLIFTSQAWNMTFSFYQSMTTIPGELREAAAVFRLHPWLRFRVLELPFAAIGLVWNSVMSWAGGWFFLMAAEIFNVGDRDFRLPGLGSYLQTAAVAGDRRALVLGIVTLTLIIVVLDQLVWRPLLAWTDKFKVGTVEGGDAPTSWFLRALSRSWILDWLARHVSSPMAERADRLSRASADGPVQPLDVEPASRRPSIGLIFTAGVVAAAVLYGSIRTAALLFQLPWGAWGELALGLLATFGRVAASLLLALVWTVPVGVLIGTRPKLAAVLQPVVQVVASLPASALFPVLAVALLRVPGGLSAAAVLLMLMGTQWYLLFNAIAGAAAIPADLRQTTELLRLSWVDRWRTLILPALFPYLITGAITASGGAWNASIVAEHLRYGGRQFATLGIGAIIARATAEGAYPLLLAGTLIMVLTVVGINRTLWRRLYVLAEQRYRLE